MEASEVHDKVVKGFAWEALTKLIVQVVSWVVTIYVARVLAPTDYGILAIATIYTMLLTQVAEMGLASGLINRKEVDDEHMSGIFWLSALLGIVIYALLYLLAPLIASFQDLPILTDILRVSGLVLILSTFKIIPSVILMRELNFKYKALAEMISHFANSVTVLTLVLMGYGVWSLVWSVLVQQLVLVVLFLRVVPAIPKFGFYFSKTKEVIVYGWHMMSANFVGYAMLYVDQWVVGKTLGANTVGSYAMAYQFATMPLDKVGSIFNHITFPAISRLKEKTDEARRTFLKMHRYLIIIAYPILTGMFLLAEDFVMLILVEEGETKWLPVIPILQGLCLINLLRVSGMLFPPTIEGLGKPKRVLQYHIHAIILLPICFYLGSFWDIEGVLISWFIGYPILYWSVLKSIKSYLNITMKEFILSIKSALVSTFIMVLGVFYMQSVTADWAIGFRIMVTVASGALFYAGTYFLFFRSEIHDVVNGIKMLRSE